MNSRFDVLVAGAGPAGLVAAAVLARRNLRVCLLGPPAAIRAEDEGRTAALFPTGVALLSGIGAWARLSAVSEPIHGIRIVDDMRRLLRAPEVCFRAVDAGLEVLAHNVPNGALVAALEAVVAEDRQIERNTVSIVDVQPGAAGVDIMTGAGDIHTAPLLVAADGRKSLARSAAGIATRTWRYPQVAITTAFAHSRPHRGLSTEFHRPAGPFTVVPLPGRRSSLVWLERPEMARDLAALDDASFIRQLEERLGGLLGRIEAVAPRVSYPMAGLIAERRAARRIALVGETAHAFPPIGAQGLNLTLRDIAALAALLEGPRAASDPGADAVLADYERDRAADVTARVYGVDLLNRSLIAGPLAGLARGVGLHALKAIPGLKRLAMAEGFGAASATRDTSRASTDTR